MKTNTLFLAVLAAAILVCVPFAATAAEDGVTLEYKFKGGESVEYVLSVDANSFFTLYGLEKKIVQQSLANFKMTEDPATTTDKFIALILEIISEKINADGEKIDSPQKGSKINMKLTKSGKIMETSDPLKLQYFQDMLVSFPEKPVKKGDEWKIENTMKIPKGDGTETPMKAVITCKVADFKKFEGKNCAIIETKLETLEDKTRASDVRVESSGRIYFDHENGKLVGSQNNFEMDLKVMDDNNPSKKMATISTLKVRMNVKLTMK